MRLPRNILTGNYMKPRIFLCEVDKEKIGQLETTDTKGSLKFNAYSELSFTVGRTYNDVITGKTLVNPYYDKIEGLRLIYLENIGYFEIQTPELVGDGIKETKNITAYSFEYILSQKYLDDFYINTGEVSSQEVINASSEDHIIPITLYDPANPKLSLLHLVLEKCYGWKIGHVDEQLKTLSRQFEIDRQSVYDFLMNEVCQKFNCYIDFDTINNEINIYAESPTAKFIGDGKTKAFKIGNADNTFSEVKTVSIDGYKTTKWEYKLGTLILEEAPAAGSTIEVVGVDATWETDVFVTFDNLSQEITVNYNADDIKTVLTVTYGDDHDIREVNLGLPYIVDLSYYTTPEWMGQDLYDTWIAYQKKCNDSQSEYTSNSNKMLEWADKIDYETNRLSLGYAKATVDATTVGTYYVRDGGAHPNYYYKEVLLPSEYNANTTYYSTKTCNLEDGSDGNVMALYTALKKYFMKAEDWKTELEGLSEDFNDFMGQKAIENLSATLSKIDKDNRFPKKNKNGQVQNNEATNAIASFLDVMWNEIGRTPLKQLYSDAYYKIQIAGVDAGWSVKTHAEYGNYYTTVLFTDSLDRAIDQRDAEIKKHQKEYDKFIQANKNISDSLLISNNFTEVQLVRLSAFLREDELNLDDIVTTAQDSIADTFKTQQDALESARIELQKRCQPQLQFSMSMANIYALPEFEPIVDQFQLGNITKVGIRPDYIKQSRLMQVDINFDDFSDFSCEFGELTSLRSQSDIHADLLKNAISAGKSVAQNASYWTRGSDQATFTDLKIQQGLLDAVAAIKSNDGQEVAIDKYGIHLRKKIKGAEEFDDKQGWIVNNQFLYSDDGFKSAKAVFGEYQVPMQINQETGKMEYANYWGLLAEAVISGYIEGSRIRGGTIQIGEQKDENGNLLLDKNGDPIYAFEVHTDGSVTMNGGSSIAGYAKEETVKQLVENLDTTIISNTAPENAKEGQLWLDTSTEPYSLKIFNNGKWIYFSQKNGETIYVTQPESYQKGDLWIINENDLYNSHKIIDGLSSVLFEQIWRFNATYYTKNGLEVGKISYKDYEGATKDNPGNYTTREDGSIDYRIYTSHTSVTFKMPNPAIMYHNAFFGSVGYNWGRTGDSITIYDNDNNIICSQSDITYYGSDKVAEIAPSEDVELYLIYSDGQMYLVKKNMVNKFLCNKTESKFINATLLQAIQSSTTFSYDHWVDISPEETELQNNIYQNFEFNKETGLKIGQTDNKFYVNIDSQKMGFHSVDGDKNDVEVVQIGINSATVQNATFKGSNGTTFDNNAQFNQEVGFGNFVWQEESDGSLSLSVKS